LSYSVRCAARRSGRRLRASTPVTLPCQA
jgi:hypothetical protein